MSNLVHLSFWLLQLVAQHVLVLLLVARHVLNCLQSLIARLLIVLPMLVEFRAGRHVSIHLIEDGLFDIGIQLLPPTGRKHAPINDQMSAILGQLVIPVLFLDELSILNECLGLACH